MNARMSHGRGRMEVRRLTVALGISAAIVILPAARTVSGQQAAGGPGQPICGTPGTVCKTLPKIILQEPEDTSPKPWTGKFLPDGQPDLRGGVWRVTDAGNGYLWNPQVNASSPGWEKYKQKTTRIIDPPDGLPPYQPWAKALQEGMEAGYADPKVPEHLDPQGQCLTGIPKLEFFVGAYKVLQTPGNIAFAWEGYHQSRIIPLDGSPHIGPRVKLWMGDARGHWDQNTLVVDTTNINGKARMTIFGDFFSPDAHLRERFIYLSPEKMIYEITIDDPTVYTRPYTMRVKYHVRVKDTELWEEDCKENLETRPSWRGGEVLDLLKKK